MSIELVMPSNCLILCRPLLLLSSIFPSTRVFSYELDLHIRWPEYWSLSFCISPSNEYSGLISFRTDWLISLQSKGLSRVFSNTIVQKHQLFNTQCSLLSNPHIITWLLEKTIQTFFWNLKVFYYKIFALFPLLYNISLSFILYRRVCTF